MQRKTALEIQQPLVVRSQKKNKSCQLTNSLRKYLSKIKMKFACSQTIVSEYLNQFFSNLQQQLRLSDERQYLKHCLTAVDYMEKQLFTSMNPLELEDGIETELVKAQEEPLTVVGDLLFRGGGKISFGNSRIESQRTSILRNFINIHKRQKSSQTQVVFSSISTKCLLKAPKEQQKKRTFEKLMFCEIQKSDRGQELIREKIYKDFYRIESNHINPTKQRLERKSKLFNLFANVDEYSYDYDGSVIPIKTAAKSKCEKVNVLNTTCKLVNHVNTKETRLKKKQSLKSEVRPFHYLKTEMDAEEACKQNMKQLKCPKMPLRKQSTSHSTCELKSFDPIIGPEAIWKQKFEQIVKNRAVKIRELKYS